MKSKKKTPLPKHTPFPKQSIPRFTVPMKGLLILIGVAFFLLAIRPPQKPHGNILTLAKFAHRVFGTPTPTPSSTPSPTPTESPTPTLSPTPRPLTFTEMNAQYGP